MKIQCDVCNKEQASVFCSADEAALCDRCDRRVHYANKLAGKHHRFSLFHPLSKEAPRCDICQERRAILFCQQDRALLCGECDLPIHTANELTQKHNRFLLTGVKLSASSVPYKSTTATTSSETKMTTCNQPSVKKPTSISPELFNPPKEKTTETGIDYQPATETSSISEYLIEMLPGWQVEDLLESTSPPLGFCKPADLWSFTDADFGTNRSSFSSEDLTMRVPQAPAPPPPPLPGYSPHTDGQNGNKAVSNVKNSQKWSDDGFSVPQIIPSLPFKRCRTFR